MIVRRMMKKVGKLVSSATLNPNDKSSSITLSNGNLTASSSTWGTCVRSTASIPSSGKCYWEVVYDNAGGNSQVGIGTASMNLNSYCGGDAYGWGWATDGYLYHGGQNAGTAWTTGDRLMVAVNRALGYLWLGKNGGWISGNPALGTNPSWTDTDITNNAIYAVVEFGGSGTGTANIKFSEADFSYAMPSGFTVL